METKIQFAFCVALLFLGLAGAVAWRNATRGAEAFEAVEHTHKVMAEIETVMIAMLTIENGMNRFVATGEAKFLEPGYHAREVVSQSLAKLKQLTQDNPRQQKRLEQLESLTAQCRVNMAQVIRTRRTNEIAAKEIILVEKSKLLNDGIQTLINEMEEEETQLQRQRGEAVQAAAQASIRLVEAGGLVAVLITGASGLAVLRVTRRRVQADRALRESKESLAVTLQSIGDGVLATDAEARITRLNAVAEALTGWKETEAIGRPVGEIFRIVNEATRQPAFLPVADTLAKGTTHGLANHTVLIARDGMERHIADSCAPIRGRDGKVLGAVLVFRDVSQERATERLMAQATAETRDLYNHAPCGYHSVNADGVFVSINDTELNWLGYTREELIGQKKHRDLVSLDTRPTYDLGFQHFLEHGEVRDLEFKQVHKDGTERYVLLNATCVRDEMGRLQHSRSTLFDITERKQMEARLEHERYLLRTLMDNMPASIYFKDERSRFLRTNQALARRIGLDDPALMTGKTDADYFSPEHAAKALADEQRVMQSGQMINQEERESLPDGRVSWLLTVKLPLRDEAGRIVGTFGVSHDITARKQTEAALEQERHLFHTLMDNIPASIYFKDEESRFLRNNRAHACRLGCEDPAQMLGKTDHDYFGAEHAAKAFDEEQTVMRTGEPITLEGKETLPDGRESWVMTVKLPLRDKAGRIVGTFGVSHDITERKEGEENIVRLNADIQSQSARLAEANRELAKVSKLKDEFLANMSHELRTPLNAILGLSEALLEQVSGPLSPRQVKAVTTISTSGQHLLSLINDILDLSKIEAGKLDLHAEELEVEEFCQSCLIFVRTQAMQKQIGVQFERVGDVARFKADPKRFKQILVNLLTNAVKFTPQGGQIGLTVEASGADEVVHFCVWDTGVGIASNDQGKLFQAFSQVDSGLNRMQEGTGLGLALVARLVELHGGSVRLESEPGKGSRFTISIPVAQVNASTAKSAGQAEPPPLLNQQVCRRALIIEDDPTSGEQLERYLGELAISSVLHTQGGLAAEIALREQPDVIFLDIQLPGESGWVVLARLKEHPQTRDIPVAVVSIVDEPSKALALGAIAHFTKPVTREQLAGFLQRPVVVQRLAHLRPQPKPVSSQSGPSILLAEDNEANIQTIGGYLSDRGYDMHYAMNGLVAVKLAREMRPALILMDIQMPMMDGLTAIREIRNDAQFKDTPIVALTALAMNGDQERCLAVGANDYMSKPVKLKELATLIDRLLAKPNEEVVA